MTHVVKYATFFCYLFMLCVKIEAVCIYIPYLLQLVRNGTKNVGNDCANTYDRYTSLFYFLRQRCRSKYHVPRRDSPQLHIPRSPIVE